VGASSVVHGATECGGGWSVEPGTLSCISAELPSRGRIFFGFLTGLVTYGTCL
jgi:hypothetical protein